MLNICIMLHVFGFNSRIKGDHHISSKKGIDEIILFWSEEDNAYITEVPEFPGCIADAKSYEEALKNA